MSQDVEKNEVTDEKKTKKEEKKLKKKQKKLEKKAASSDSKLIIIIVALVMVVALAIFGYFLYNKMLRPVAKFNGGSVNASDYEIYYRTFAPVLQMYGYDSEGIADLIVEKAVSDKITVNEAKKAGIKISDEDKAYVDEIFADEEQIETFKNSGIDPVRMKQFYYNDYIMDAYIEHLAKNFTDEEVKQYIIDSYGEDAEMEEYVTNHILFLKNNPETNQPYSEEEIAAKKAKAEEILTRALAGEDFEALAKEFSEDKGTASEGGRYNLYKDGNTVQEYVDAVVSMSAGQVYGSLVETQYGYHIIKLTEFNEQGRVHSDTERQALAYKKIDEIIDAANVQKNTKNMNAVVERITKSDKDDDTEIVESQDNNTENEGEEGEQTEGEQTEGDGSEAQQ